jgi:mannitol 2-dehydrogenase
MTVSTGIVHIGAGNFHRSHQAMYIDRLGQPEWSICGVGMLPGDIRVRDALLAQDFRYTLVLRHPDGSLEPKTISSITDYIYTPADPSALVPRLAHPATRIVSLTITEGGYGQDSPALSAIADALVLRRSAGVPPFTVMSCDNIELNGSVAQAAIAARAGEWVRSDVAFPNSMVDRITPVTTDADRLLVRSRFGIADDIPVMAEPFVQWVLEDRFSAGRPQLEQVGVQMVDNVRPYELMKLRLLNAGHLLVGYFGVLLGYTFVHEAVGDPLITSLLRRYMDSEATPTLDPVPGLEAYKDSVIERFGNPAMADTLERICASTSDRIPRWIYPVIQARPAAPIATAVIAAWAAHRNGIDEHGRPITASPLLVAAFRTQGARATLSSLLG